MEVGSPDWIEASLAKLEQLEQQRATHERAIETVKEPMALRRHTDALAKLDAEIKALYAQLEEFAEDDEDEEEEQAAAAIATPERRTVGDETLSAPHTMAEPLMPSLAPLATPISNAPPFASPPISVAPSPMAMAPSPSMDDDIPTGSSGKWIALGVVLVAGLGVGGFFMMQNMKKADSKPAPAGSGEVIKAADVPDDTEAPKAAKGADVDRTPTENAGGGTTAPTKKDTKKDAAKKVIKLGEGEDPLG